MEARKQALMESMLERKLNALHADYEATLAAEARKTEQTKEAEEETQANLEYHQVGDPANAQEGDEWADAEFQSGGAEEHEEPPVPLHPLPASEDTGLDAAKIEFIKTVMSGIQLKAPSWLANLPEDVWISNISASVTAPGNPPKSGQEVKPKKSTEAKLLHTEYTTVNSNDVKSKKVIVKKKRTKAKRANYDATNPNIAGQEDEDSFFAQSKQPESHKVSETQKQDEADRVSEVAEQSGSMKNVLTKERPHDDGTRESSTQATNPVEDATLEVDVVGVHYSSS